METVRRLLLPLQFLFLLDLLLFVILINSQRQHANRCIQSRPWMLNPQGWNELQERWSRCSFLSVLNCQQSCWTSSSLELLRFQSRPTNGKRHPPWTPSVSSGFWCNSLSAGRKLQLSRLSFPSFFLDSSVHVWAEVLPDFPGMGQPDYVCFSHHHFKNRLLWTGE